MATSVDFANWLRNNQNKRGTADYATVLRAYQEAALEEVRAEQAPTVAAPPPAPRTGFGAALATGFENLIGSTTTAAQATFGDENKAAELALERAANSPYASQVSWDKVKEAYGSRGAVAAVGEILRQVPLAITEQLPQLAATLGGAKAGALAGTAAAPLLGPAAPAGPVIGGTLGALATIFPSLYGANIERQAAEQRARGEAVDVELGPAAGAAAVQTGLEAAATFIPLGRRVARSVFGPQVDALLGQGKKEAAEALAKENLATVLAKGIAVGAATNVPTEVLQAVAERAQAGLPLLDDDALKEYGENAYGGALVGTPLGAAGRASDWAGARTEARAAEETAAAAQRRAAAQAEKAQRESPEYLLDLDERYSAAVTRMRELQEAVKQRPGKDADPAERAEHQQKIAELKSFTEDTMRPVTAEYVKRKAEIAQLKERQRVEGMTPLDYLLEQTQVSPIKGIAPGEAPLRTEADTEIFPAVSAPAPKAEYATSRIALANEQRYAEGMDPKDRAKVYAEYLMGSVPTARQLVAADEPIPGVSASVSRSVLAQLKLQLNAYDRARAERLKGAPIAQLEAEEAAALEDTARAEEARLAETEERRRLGPEITALQRMRARRLPESVREEPYIEAVAKRAARAAPAPAPQPSAAVGQVQQLLTGQDVTYTAEEPKERQLRRVPGEGFKLFGEGAIGRKELLDVIRRYTDIRQEEQELRAALPEKPVLGRSTEEEITAYKQAVAAFDDFVKNKLRPVETEYQRRKPEIDALRAAEAAPAKTPDTKLLRERINRALFNPDLSDAAYDLLRRAENLLPDVEMRLETLRTVQDPTRGTQQDLAQTAGLLELLDKQLTQIEQRQEGLPTAGRTLEQQRRPIAPGAANVVEPTFGTKDDIKLARQRNFADLVAQGFSPGEAARRAFQIGKPTREAQEVPTDRFATPVLPPESGREVPVTQRFAGRITPMQPREPREQAPGPVAERQPGRFLAQQPRKGTIRAQGAPLSLASEIEPLLDALERARAEDAGQQVLFPELERERGTIASTPEAFRRRLNRLKAVKDGYARELLRKEAAIEPLEQEIAQLEETLAVYQQQQKAFENAQFILNNNAALLKELRVTGAGTEALRGGMGALALSEKNLKRVADAFAQQRTLINAYLERIKREKAQAPELKASNFNELSQLLATRANDEARAKQALEFVQEELTRITRAEEDIYNRQFPQLDRAKETARAGMRDLHRRYGEASGWLDGLKELRAKIQRQYETAQETQKQRTSDPEVIELVAELGQQLAAIDRRVDKNKALMDRLETQIAVAVAEAKISTLKAEASPEAVKRASDELVAAKQRLRALRSDIFKGRAKEVEGAAAPEAEEKDYAERLKTHQRMLEAMQLRTESGTIVPALSYAQRLAREAGSAAGADVKFSVDDLALLDKDPKRVLNGLVSRATDLENKIKQAVARSRGAEFSSEKEIINRYSRLLSEYEDAETALERAQLEPELSLALREYNDALNKSLNQRVVWKGQARDTAELLNTYKKIAYLEERFFLPQPAEKRAYRPETKEETAARKREAEAIFESQREAQAGAGETTGEALTRSQAAKQRKAQKTVYSGKGVGPEELSKKDAEDLLIAEGKQTSGQPLTSREQQLIARQAKADKRIAENARIKEQAAKNALVRAAFEKKERKEQLTPLEQFLYDEAVSAGAKTAEDVDAISLEEAAATETKPSRGARTTEEAVDEETRAEVEETFARRAGFENIELSRGATATPSTTDSVRTELRKAFPDLGRVQIYDSVDALVKANPQYEGRIPADARGFVDTAGNKAFLIAENIDQGRALGVLLHEVGAHIGLKNMLGDAQYNALVKAVETWAKKTDGSTEAKVAQAALARVEAAQTPASQRRDETLAYAIEEAVNAGVKPMETKGVLGQWLSRVATLFRRALEKFGLPPKALDAQGLVDMAFGAAKMEMRGQAAPAAEARTEPMRSKPEVASEDFMPTPKPPSGPAFKTRILPDGTRQQVLRPAAKPEGLPRIEEGRSDSDFYKVTGFQPDASAPFHKMTLAEAARFGASKARGQRKELFTRLADLFDEATTPEKQGLVLATNGRRSSSGAYGAFYRQSNVVFTPGIKQTGYLETLLHELTHAASSYALSVDKRLAGRVESLRRKAEAWAETKEGKAYIRKHAMFLVAKDQQGNRGIYGLKNIDEFLSELYADREFQKFLTQIPSDAPKKNLLTRFVEFMSSFFSAPDQAQQSLFAEAVALSEEVLETTRREIYGTDIELSEVRRSRLPFGIEGPPDVAFSTKSRIDTYEAAKKHDARLLRQVEQFLLTGTPVPAPTTLYRGGVAPGQKYTHATPWAGVAAKAGKLIGYDPRKPEPIYEYEAAEDQKYYRGGALEGDPLETTRIHNAKGMTWDQALAAAKKLFDAEVRALPDRYTDAYLANPENKQDAIEAVAGQVTEDFFNAVYETDAANRPGVWANRKVPDELMQDTPKLRETAPSEILFSRKTAYTPGLADAGRVAEQLVGGQRSFLDKVKANLFGFRTQIVDMRASLEKVSFANMDELKATQLMFNIRMYDQRNHFVSESLATGVPERKEIIRDDGQKEFVIEAKPGANIKQMVERLSTDAVVKEAGSPDAANQLFTLYTAAKRAERVGFQKLGFGRAAAEAELVQLNKELSSETLDPADRKRIMQRKDYLEKNAAKMPSEADIKAAVKQIEANKVLREAFEDVREMYNEYNRNLLEFAVQTGAIPDALAKSLLAAKDYIPYYRVRGGNAELVIGGEQPMRIGNIKDSPQLEELVGGEEPIFDFLTSSVQNTSMLLDMSLRNMAVKNAMWELRDVGLAKLYPARNEKGGRRSVPENAVRFRVKGEDWFAIVDTDAAGVPSDLLVKGLAGMPTMLPAGVKMLAIPARILRRAIVANPVYMARQLFRDSVAATLASGANMTPVLSSLKQLGKKNALDRRGITGGQVFTGMPEDMSRMLREMQTGRPGWAKAWSALERAGMEADAATRRAQFNSYREQGLSEMEASYLALESMNFSKRGLSPTVHLLNMIIPFFNAQIQGLDVLYRSLRGQMPFNKRLNIRNKLYTRGALLFISSMAYAAAMQDEEEYKNARPDEKYGNWFVRMPFLDEYAEEPVVVRVPIPFELGYIFKALPEAIVNTMASEEGGKEALKALKQIVINTIPGGSSMPQIGGFPVPVPLPAGVKPAIELAMGRSFFTGRDIESTQEQQREPGERFRDNTSEAAKAIGQTLGISPIQLEYAIRGYTGGMGMALLQSLNFLMPEGEGAQAASRRMADLPLVGTLFQPMDAGGIIDATYERMKEIQQVQRTYENMLETGRRADAERYAAEKADELSAASVAGQFRQVMGEITTFERNVRASPTLSPAEKREKLDLARQRKIEIAQRARALFDRRTLPASPA